jgi:Raf kinase inhibitor-like YbhB/YbcL family protein
MKKSILVIGGVLLLIVIPLTLKFMFMGNNVKENASKPTQQGAKSEGMKITSPVFENQGKIPAKYACTGENVSPPLRIDNVPTGTKSLVLIVDDPDAPNGTWVHWVVYNIDPSVTDIAESSIPQSGIEALTSSGKRGYSGPCPPSGEHHYFFKLYAIDNPLSFYDPSSVDKKLLEEEMQGHILEQTELVGLFSK